MKKLIMISLVGMSLNVYGTAETEERSVTPLLDPAKQVCMQEQNEISPSKDSVASDSSLSSNPSSDELVHEYSYEPALNTSPALKDYGKDEKFSSRFTASASGTEKDQSSEYAVSAGEPEAERTINDIVRDDFGEKDLAEIRENSDQYCTLIEKFVELYNSLGTSKKTQQGVREIIEFEANAHPSEVYACSDRIKDGEKVVSKCIWALTRLEN